MFIPHTRKVSKSLLFLIYLVKSRMTKSFFFHIDTFFPNRKWGEMKIGNKEKGAIFPTHRNVTLDPFLIYSVTLYEHFFRFSPSFLTSPRRTFFFLSTPSSFCSHSHLVISFSMSVVIKSFSWNKKSWAKRFIRTLLHTYPPSSLLLLSWYLHRFPSSPLA